MPSDNHNSARAEPLAHDGAISKLESFGDNRAGFEQLVRRFVLADRTPAQLAEELGMTLEQLAKWGWDRGNIAVLQSLARLSDIRAQLLLSQFRANAAAQLIHIATEKEPSELSRKACVDLLNANLEAFGESEAGPEIQPAAHAPLSEEAMYRILDRLGKEDDDGESAPSL